MIPVFILGAVVLGLHFLRLHRIDSKLDQPLEESKHMSASQDQELDLLAQLKQGITDAAARIQAKLDSLAAAAEDPAKAASIIGELQTDVTTLGALGS